MVAASASSKTIRHIREETENTCNFSSEIAQGLMLANKLVNDQTKSRGRPK